MNTIFLFTANYIDFYRIETDNEVYFNCCAHGEKPPTTSGYSNILGLMILKGITL